MSNFDFDAHKHLVNKRLPDVQEAVNKAIEKAQMGVFNVCITTAGEVLVLPEFSASVRDDISETVYSTDSGYQIATNSKKEAK